MEEELARRMALVSLQAQGLPPYEMGNWYGLVAPPGTPKSIVARSSAYASSSRGENSAHWRASMRIGIGPTRRPACRMGMALSVAHWRCAWLLARPGTHRPGHTTPRTRIDTKSLNYVNH